MKIYGLMHFRTKRMYENVCWKQKILKPNTYLQGSAKAVTTTFPTLWALSCQIGLDVCLNTEAAVGVAAAFGILHKYTQQST